MKRLLSALILFAVIFLSAYFCRGGDAIRVAVLRKWMRLSRNIVTAMNGKIPLTWKGFCALEYREREQIVLIMPSKSEMYLPQNSQNSQRAQRILKILSFI